jgi:pimeloyl-ACP methyl ester carboxylesterase
VEKIKSTDGTQIAFDRIGKGPPVILIGGAFSWRRWKGFVELADLLAARFTVLNYDRRGRGDSGDTQPYALEREFEDLQAMIRVAGGSASVWGMSSGGILALEAARAGVAIEKIAAYEPPFIVDSSEGLPPDDFVSHVGALVDRGRRSEAVKYFMARVMGMPSLIPSLMSLWPANVVQAEGDRAHPALRGRHHRPLRPRSPPRRDLLGANRDTDADRKRREEPGEA